MEEKSNILLGRPNEMVETLISLIAVPAFLEQLNTFVAVPEGEERLLTLKKAFLFFYNLDVLQIVHYGFF